MNIQTTWPLNSLLTFYCYHCLSIETLKPSLTISSLSWLISDSYYSPHGDGYSKGDLEMDSESSLGGLGDVLNGNGANSNGGDESLSSHHPLHNHPHSQQQQLISNHQHPHPHHHHHHHNSHQGSSSLDNPSNNNGNSLFGSSMTPIDRLCSMSNSYFNSSTECECIGPTN